MSRVLFPLWSLAAALGMMAPMFSRAQSVAVTVQLETNRLNVGQSTSLKVYGQVVPGLRSGASQIFSWYIDVLNTNETAAAANYGALVKSASDNDPLVSSTGMEDGANRRGVFDTFLNLPGAGVSQPVELLSVPVTGMAPGLTQFRVQAGSGVPELSEDFIVAPLGGGDPLTGGDYGAATASLEVVQSCAVTLHIQPQNGGGPGQPLLLTFTPCPGFNHTVQFVNQLTTGANWQALPGAPHNSGSVTVTNTGPIRFFRVMTTPQ
jgi:hypothetical protein